MSPEKDCSDGLIQNNLKFNVETFDTQYSVKKKDCPEKEQGGRIQNKCISWRPISLMDVEKSHVMLNINLKPFWIM